MVAFSTYVIVFMQLYSYLCNYKQESIDSNDAETSSFRNDALRAATGGKEAGYAQICCQADRFVAV